MRNYLAYGIIALLSLATGYGVRRRIFASANFPQSPVEINKDKLKMLNCFYDSHFYTRCIFIPDIIKS